MLTVHAWRQIPIKAGHEFIVSTEDKYAEACDDKVLYMDYVSRSAEYMGPLSQLNLVTEKLAQSDCTRQAHLRR